MEKSPPGPVLRPEPPKTAREENQGKITRFQSSGNRFLPRWTSPWRGPAGSRPAPKMRACVFPQKNRAQANLFSNGLRGDWRGRIPPGRKKAGLNRAKPFRTQIDITAWPPADLVGRPGGTLRAGRSFSPRSIRLIFALSEGPLFF